MQVKLICVIDDGVPGDLPLLTHYKSDDNNLMVYNVSNDIQLVFDISSEYYIFEYVSGKITMRELILKGTSYRIRQYKDIGTTTGNRTVKGLHPVVLVGAKNNIMTTEIENVPEEYLPSEDSYFGHKIPEAYDHFVVDEKISKMLGK